MRELCSNYVQFKGDGHQLKLLEAEIGKIPFKTYDLLEPHINNGSLSLSYDNRWPPNYLTVMRIGKKFNLTYEHRYNSPERNDAGIFKFNGKFSYYYTIPFERYIELANLLIAEDGDDSDFNEEVFKVIEIENNL